MTDQSVFVCKAVTDTCPYCGADSDRLSFDGLIVRSGVRWEAVVCEVCGFQHLTRGGGPQGTGGER